MSAAINYSTDSSMQYFICTLGEVTALSPDCSHWHTVNGFIDYQARVYPKDVAVGFPIPSDGSFDWKYELFSFEDLRHGSLAIAAEVKPYILQSVRTSAPQCVALLCPSSIDFLFAWLGFMRAGLSVLLIAPQCQPAAIAHLCKSCQVSVLFHCESYTNLANRASSEADSRLRAIQLPWKTRNSSITCVVRNNEAPLDAQLQGTTGPLDTAFIFHTSGTSTGLPKPITQSHRAVVGVLPVLNGQQCATFTTTPLYHGGISDCFRAWTSRAPIWLFPAADVPITAHNIHLCLLAAAKASSEICIAEVTLFSCVPYVLQMLSEDSLGLKNLQRMKTVGVGGAALSPNVGNHLVESGVNLVSRYGSAECGFLLASHRDYSTDKDWQYLRLSPRSNYLHFEEQKDKSGLFELIVKKGWPHMAKANREDGSFATRDLFEPHPTIEGAWKYHSRSDSQITLSTGKKFDPEPLENLISSSSPLIREVLVFGSGKMDPGVLLFPTKEGLTIKYSDLEGQVWKTINAINYKGQAHTRIYRDKVVIVRADQPVLERSSKGTLLRERVEKVFAKQIDSVYTLQPSSTGEESERAMSGGDVREAVRRTVIDVGDLDDSLKDDADFYAHGIDSVMCTRIRLQLQKNLVSCKEELPWNVVYDCGNINRLSQFVIDFRGGNVEPFMNERIEMLQLVRRFSELEGEAQPHDSEKRTVTAPYVVLLTGATGALGANILDFLRKSPLITQIICLVRAVDHFAARSRVSASLVKRKKSSLDISDPKVWCSPCKLNEPSLGLSEMELSHIQQSATHVIHAAWAVNFSLPLKSFVEHHISGIHNLLNLTLSCSKAVQFNFCSSTASINGPDRSSIIEEKVSIDPVDAGYIGYSRSKWVAEAICASASKTLPGTVRILRIGQLTGDTENGVWNISEAWPLLLSTVDAVHCLPQLDEPLKWLPLDIAATAIIEIALQSTQNDQQPRVYHIVNNSLETTWSNLLAWSKESRPLSFDIVTPLIWLDKLEKITLRHPAKNLLGFWRNVYGNEATEGSPDQQRAKTAFSTTESQKDSGAMQNVKPVNQALVNKIWLWLDLEIKGAKKQVYVSRNRFQTE